MYQISKHDQRSVEWSTIDRLGKWTASFFDKAITATGKRSASSDEVNNRLIAEIILGRPDENFQSEAMLRGIELEDEALEFLNFTRGYNFKKVGFLDSTLGYGCSPDGLDEENRIGLELKCPSAHTHLEYLAGKELPKKYKQQVQGAMLVTGFQEWIFFSYHPEIKPFVIVVKRDEEYISEMKKTLEACCFEMRTRLAELTEYLSDKETA